MNVASTVDMTLTHEEYQVIRSALIHTEVAERLEARTMAANGFHEMSRTSLEFADRIRNVLKLFPTKR